MPKLSFIVPVYNTEQYLCQCLDSIIDQDNGQIEIILVDDGSTDSSKTICDQYAERYPDYIRVIHKENQGLLLARRTGIAYATGDYIAHVDSDDYLLDDAVNTICHAIDTAPCDMLFFDYIYGEGQGKPERYIKIRDDSDPAYTENKSEIIDQFLFGGYFNCVWMKVCRRTVVDSGRDYTPFKNVANGEDVLQTLALIDNASSFLYIPKALYYYRRDNMSMSKIYGTKDYYSFRSVNLETLTYATKWRMSQTEICDLKSSFLGKCMVILHQVRNNAAKKEYFELMKTMSRDDYFLSLNDALRSSHTSRYYRVIYRLISKKRYKLTDSFIHTVAKLKS